MAQNSSLAFETLQYHSKPVNIVRNPSISLETHQYHSKSINIIRNPSVSFETMKDNYCLALLGVFSNYKLRSAET